MASADVIRETSNPAFYTRVAFIALKAANDVANEDPQTANHANRLAYAQMLFRGGDKPLNLAMHVVAVNPTIASTLAKSGHAAVPDNDIEFVMGQIWNQRANAMAAGV